MIEQPATVVAVADGAALVEVARTSGCAACERAPRCESATLARLFGNGASTRLRLHDHLGVAPGDQVLVGVRNQTLVRASLVAYLLPVVTLVGSASAAEAAAASDLVSALAGVLGLGIGLALTALVTGGTGARARFRPVLLQRISDRPPIQIPPVHPAVGG
jgi:sigma-E factor negative regulatory protein RseC